MYFIDNASKGERISYTLKEGKEPRKSDIASKRKHMISEGAFKLFRHEEQNIQDILQIVHKNRREASMKAPFRVKYTYKQDNVKITDFKFRLLEREYGLNNYSYIISCKNTAPHNKSVSTTLILKDPDGFEICTSYTGSISVPAGGTEQQTAT